VKNNSRKISWWYLCILICAGYLIPIAIPMGIKQQTTDAYDAIESLQAGDVVLVVFECSIGSFPEVRPAAIATMRQYAAKGVRMVITGVITADAFPVSQLIMASAKLTEFSGYETYGENWVNLGFIAGGDISAAALADNCQFTVNDAYGNALADLPLMQDVHTYEDFKMIIAYNTWGYEPWLFHWTTKYGWPPIVAFCTGATARTAATHWAADQILGYTNGLRGGAEYETLLGVTGEGLGSMTVLSATHFSAIALMIWGNLILLRRRLAGGS
jgi:hypothetical protein